MNGVRGALVPGGFAVLLTTVAFLRTAAADARPIGDPVRLVVPLTSRASGGMGLRVTRIPIELPASVQRRLEPAQGSLSAVTWVAAATLASVALGACAGGVVLLGPGATPGRSAVPPAGTRKARPPSSSGERAR